MCGHLQLVGSSAHLTLNLFLLQLLNCFSLYFSRLGHCLLIAAIENFHEGSKCDAPSHGSLLTAVLPTQGMCSNKAP